MPTENPTATHPLTPSPPSHHPPTQSFFKKKKNELDLRRVYKPSQISLPLQPEAAQGFKALGSKPIGAGFNSQEEFCQKKKMPKKNRDVTGV